jgi:hypothetical protein
MNAQTNDKLPTIYAVEWHSGWANIPDEIKAGFFTKGAAEAHPLVGRETYDGVSAATEGRFRVIELAPPKALKTIVAQGYELGMAANGYDAGAWKEVDGKFRAHPKRFNGEEWNWTKEEYRYIFAYSSALDTESE